MTSGDACVIRSGAVWCWWTDATTPVNVPSRIYGDDAEQVVLHNSNYAILRRNGEVIHRDGLRSTTPAVGPAWTGVRDLGSNVSNFMMGASLDGPLLWADTAGLGRTFDNPPRHVRRVGGAYPNHACWQIIGAEVWCLIGRTPFVMAREPLVDWSVGGDGRTLGVSPNGEVLLIRSPMQVEKLGVNDGVQVASGLKMHCVLRASGSIRCFEDEGSRARDLGEVAALKDAVAIAAGGYAGCALRSDGRVTCWSGADLSKLLDLPEPTK